MGEQQESKSPPLKLRIRALGATRARGRGLKMGVAFRAAVHSRGCVRSGPLLSPPLQGVRRAAQLRTIASGGESAEVTSEARPPAVVGGAEVSPELESEVSQTQGSAAGRQGGAVGAAGSLPAPPSRRRGSA